MRGGGRHDRNTEQSWSVWADPMTTAVDHQSTVAAPPTARVCLVPARADRAVLDGGWWPRSTDPVTELPSLILVLSERYGPIRQMMLNGDAWDTHPRRLPVGTRVIRLGWFTTLDPALAIATTERGDQLDLLVVPPNTAETAAQRAMERAADPADTTRAPAILTAVSARPDRSVAVDEASAGSAWDNEGGSPAGYRPH